MSHDFKKYINYILGVLILIIGILLINRPKAEKNIEINRNIPDIQKHDSPKSYEEAVKLAKEKNVNILLICGAEWCSWCRKLENETLKDKEVQKVIEEKQLIEIHVNTDQRPDLVSRFSVSGLPTYFILNKEEEVLKKASGFKKVQAFIEWLN